MAKVIVYEFTLPGNQNASNLKGTRGAIEHLPDATIIESSAEEIDVSQLNHSGYYAPGE